MFKTSRVVLSSTLAGSAYVGYMGYTHRATLDLSPSASHPKGYTGPTFGGTPGWDWKAPTAEQLDLHGDKNMPYHKLADDATTSPPFGYRCAQYFTILAIDRVIATLMWYYGNSFNIIGDAKNYDRLKNLIIAHDPDTTVLTVSNHCCTLDDPILFGKMLPDEHSHNFNNQRWSLCSQEVCFKKPALATFFSAGKVLPIKRGAGPDQVQLLNFSRKAAQGGQWLHLFPEGKIYQSGELGEKYFLERTQTKADAIGRLKWGGELPLKQNPERRTRNEGGAPNKRRAASCERL